MIDANSIALHCDDYLFNTAQVTHCLLLIIHFKSLNMSVIGKSERLKSNVRWGVLRRILLEELLRLLGRTGCVLMRNIRTQVINSHFCDIQSYAGLGV
jgi:hypothetical protein